MGSHSLSRGQMITGAVVPTGNESAEFTNVTELSWPGVAVHPRYAGARGYRQLRAELAEDLATLPYEVLARLSWEIAACAR